MSMMKRVRECESGGVGTVMHTADCRLTHHACTEM